MKRSIKLVMSVMICQQIAGCSFFFGDEGYFRDRGGDYLKAKTTPPITIPLDMSQTSLEPLFDIPKIEEDSVLLAIVDVPRPNKVSINAGDENVRIQTLGSRQWIVIDSPPEQVWPRVLEFLAENDVDVTIKKPTEGLIETDWLAFEDDTVTKNKYRIRIEQSLRRGSAEIHVIHNMVPLSVEVGGQLTWPQTSVNAERETWMVEELAGNLVDVAGYTGVSLMAQSIMSKPKTKLVGNDSIAPYIEFNVDYGRSWASLGLALEKDGFTVTHIDSDAGLYFFNYDSEYKEKDDKEPGFFSRLFSGKKSAEMKSAEDRRASSDYKVIVEQVDHLVIVKLAYLKDGELKKDQILEVLSLIRVNLS